MVQEKNANETDIEGEGIHCTYNFSEGLKLTQMH